MRTAGPSSEPSLAPLLDVPGTAAPTARDRDPRPPGSLGRLAVRAQRFSPGRLQVIGTLSVLSGLALWAVIASLIHNQLFLVGPWAVLTRTVSLIHNGTLGHNLATSGTEFAVGLAVSIAAGIPAGILIGLSENARAILQPWISGLYSTPVVALSPLLILWFGIGLTSKVVVIIAVAVFPIIANTQSGVAGISPDLAEMAECFGLSRRARIRHIFLRGSLLFVLTGIRLAVGRAVVGVVVAELFGARSGLGYQIQVDSQAYDTAGMLSAILILAVVGIGMSAIAYRLEWLAAPWLRS